MRVIVSGQLDNWKLPHVNSPLNGWGEAIWQHTFFTNITDRNLGSINCSRSALFLKIHLCENKTKRSVVIFPSFLSIFFVWATKRRAMERSWHLHSICPTLAAGRYLQQFWHLSEMTMFIENRISRHGGSKHNLGGPINYRTLNSSSKIAELKHTLKQLCTLFSASRLFHRFSQCLHSLATTMHWRLKSAQIAHHITLTVLSTRFLPKAWTFLNLRTRAPESIPHIITLRKYTLS